MIVLVSSNRIEREDSIPIFKWNSARPKLDVSMDLGDEERAYRKIRRMALG